MQCIAMYLVLYLAFTLHCTLHCTLHIVPCIPCIVLYQCTLYLVLVPCTLYCNVCNVDKIVFIMRRHHYCSIIPSLAYLLTFVVKCVLMTQLINSITVNWTSRLLIRYISASGFPHLPGRNMFHYWYIICAYGGTIVIISLINLRPTLNDRW